MTPRLKLILDSIDEQILLAKQYGQGRGNKGGQHVPFHGDFANVPISGLKRLEWWLREIRKAANEASPPRWEKRKR